MAGLPENTVGMERGQDPMLGRVLRERYEIRRLIGEGGMGRVYEGRQRALDRPVAVKCIHPHLLCSETMLTRFMEEARLVSQMLHPNIVTIYDFGRTEPPEDLTFFLVMELLTGPDLKSVIGSGEALAPARTCSILRQVLSALGEAHARGVTHRDAKPENVILEPTARGERAKLIDFGIAKVHGAPGITQVGQFVGTPHYMPPEQIRGENAEVSADLYAIAVTLFQMLTGRLPFEGDTVAAVIEQQLHAPRPDPRVFAPERNCPDGLAEVCMRALHVDVAHRYPTADAFAEALERVEAGEPPGENPLAATAPDRRRGFAPTVFVPASSPRPETAAVSASGEEGASASVIERIEVEADAELAAGRLEAAAEILRRGLSVGTAWVGAGEIEFGSAAVSVCGRKLGAILRDLGRLDESEKALSTALESTDPGESARARILADLVATLAEAGRAEEAEKHRIAALRIANAHNDRELLARLRRLAQTLALAVATRGFGGEQRVGSPPPLRSDFRLKSDRDGDGEESRDNPQIPWDEPERRRK